MSQYPGAAWLPANCFFLLCPRAALTSMSKSQRWSTYHISDWFWLWHVLKKQAPKVGCNTSISSRQWVFWVSHVTGRDLPTVRQIEVQRVVQPQTDLGETGGPSAEWSQIGRKNSLEAQFWMKSGSFFLTWGWDKENILVHYSLFIIIIVIITIYYYYYYWLLLMMMIIFHGPVWFSLLSGDKHLWPAGC